MKKRVFLLCIFLNFFLEAAVFSVFLLQENEFRQDAAAVNEAVKTVERDWNDLKRHKNATGLDYAVLDKNQAVLYQTGSHVNKSIYAAIAHGDTILDVVPDEKEGAGVSGKIIIRSTFSEVFAQRKRELLAAVFAAMLLQAAVLAAYLFYLEKNVVKPFHKLKDFAGRVAGGNLDIPLAMDKENLFGAFTESFDMMRSELKKARAAEAKAAAAKKELIAELSHDIKTPTASIKAAAEVGAALSESDKMRDNYTQIIRKADQINTLAGNLFTASLEELQQLCVSPSDMEGGALKTMLENADYLHRALIPEMPDCLIFADPLRLQQVFDNIFANSYKYADTDITVSVHRRGGCLVIAIEDYGGGVPSDEVSGLKEKFRRGSNAKETEGAGLGLFLSDYFMKEMGGELAVENGADGLKVSVAAALSGRLHDYK